MVYEGYSHARSRVMCTTCSYDAEALRYHAAICVHGHESGTRTLALWWTLP